MDLNRFALALSVSEFLALFRAGTLVKEATRGFEGAYGEPPGRSELRSWESSFAAIARVLDLPEFLDVRILVEYNVPFLLNRIDFVLISGSDSLNRCVILESKAWTTVSSIPRAKFSVRVPSLGDVIHPALQVYQYWSALSKGTKFPFPIEISPCAFLYNMESTSSCGAILRDVSFQELLHEAPIFFGDTASELRAFLSQKLGAESPHGHLAWSFPRAEFNPGPDLIQRVVNYRDVIVDKVGVSTGLQLTFAPDQIVVLDSIQAALGSGERQVILVRGAAGSGKTVLALHALFQAISRAEKARLILVNAHLREVLTGAFPGDGFRDLSYAQSVVCSPSALSGRGVLDLAICDEGQRLKFSDISNIVRRSRVSVFFYDEQQRLSLAEEGTEENFREAARTTECRHLELCGSRRMAAGSSYQRWLRGVLYNPLHCSALSGHHLTSPYEFKVFRSLEELIAALKKKRHMGHEVGLVASFTESDGRFGQRRRAAPPEVRWVMKGEYYKHWAEGGRNDLTHCASVYGAQGFEANYIGLIWGRDMAIGQSGWELHGAHTITDYVGSPSLLKLANSDRVEDHHLALELLRNRYHIFLSRGGRGVFIYCEDEKTADFLSGLQ